MRTILERTASEMGELVSDVRRALRTAVGASRHVIWYVGYQIGRDGPRDDEAADDHRRRG